MRIHLAEGGIDLPVANVVDPAAFASEVAFRDGSAGTVEVSNRFATLPMEGWDGTTDGEPTDLVRRRWQRLGESGAGLVWGEATAVVREGRANPNQLVIDETTVDGLAGLRSQLSPDQVAGLQLTHSGRYSRPEGAGPAPRTAYRHPLLDERVGADGASVLTDDELDRLVDDFVAAAVLAGRAGFDFVDVKACHGYLGHELLTAYDRPGRYGGDLAGRTTFLRSVVGGIRDAAPELAIAVRVSLFDLVPFAPGPEGVGQPAVSGPYRHAFGGDGTGLGIDLTEPHRFLDLLTELGVGLVCITAGSPYYCPHVQRPAYFPPSDGYTPPEDPLVGVARLLAATAEVTERHSDLTVVGTGYSYLQEWLPNVAQEVLARGGADLIGLGRMVLSYPELPADVLAGRPLTTELICRTFSDCTTAPRAGLVSGCYPLDPFYKERPERVELTQAKRRARRQ
ncbi:MAG: NADH:flavin oxidoreductase [Acidimicrobiales bacterium]